MTTNEFLNKQIDSIFNRPESYGEYPLNLAYASAWIAAYYKGVDLKIYDVSKISSLTDYFVIATAENAIQAISMADAITAQMKQHSYYPLSVEGTRLDAEGNNDWILVDFGNCIIHIFSEKGRNLYKLDDLWNNAPKIAIPESFYFSQTTVPASNGSDSAEDYL